MSLLDKYQSLLGKRIGLFQFMDAFSDEDECLELYFQLKFAGSNCRKCGRPVIDNYVRISRKNKDGISKKAFRCRSCHVYIYPLSDTIFRKSSIPLKDVLYIIFNICLTKSSISATRITQTIPISYKTAHKLMMLIRMVLYNNEKYKMGGEIEVDEAFIGKGSKVYNWSGISTRKQPIVGIIQRETKHLRLFLVPNRTSSTMTKLIRRNVEDGASIYTDSWKGYNNLSKYYRHEIVDHSRGEYVRGDAHTNTIENVWGTFKRNLRKAHIQISDKYVQLYLDEACWRHNSRGKLPIHLFSEILIRTFFSPYTII